MKTKPVDRPLSDQALHAIQRGRCPRCGARVFFRYVLTEYGSVSRERVELFDIVGHAWDYAVPEYLKLARDGVRNSN